jgi:PAS domain S-box-containing protein
MISILLITTIAYAVSVGYLVIKLSKISLREAYEKADIIARESANLVRTSLNHDMDISRTMVHAMSNFREIPESQRADVFTSMIYGIAIENPSILSIWGSWELNALDKSYNKPFGRQRYTYYREDGAIKYQEQRLNTEGDDIGSGYHNVKVSMKETMIDPYWFAYTDDRPQFLEASTAVPLIEDGEFRGLFGMDIPLNSYQEISNSIHPFEGSYSIMLSNNSTIVGHPNKEFLGEQFGEHYKHIEKQYKITEKVFNGDNFSFILVDSINGESYYATFASIPIGETDNPWSFGIIVPNSVLLLESEEISYNSILISIIGLLVLALVIWLIAYNITNPLVRAKNVLRELAKGKIDANKKIAISTGDEIEDISISINTLIDGLGKTTAFAKEIGMGNLNVNYTTLSNDDSLGQSLQDMRKSLINAKDQEDIRRIEDEKINWATSGMAKFAEILRSNNDNMEEFCYNIISNLVKYIDANIGALFLYNDDNKDDIHFTLVASHAYDRRKYIDKRVEIGEGLVGRCAQEKETIFLTELPKDYIQIASGLGNNSPTSLLLAPLKLNEVVYGVIELASLQVIEGHTIDFVKKIGESIAATISTVKINIKTVKLLEDSRIKSEELASQEEEMRQNMEELQATQEEADRKAAEMESLINALHVSSYVIEYDSTGKVISVNDEYLKLTNQTADQIIGTHHSDNLLLNESQLKEYNLFWENLRKGLIKKETSQVKLNGKVYSFIETYSPIFNEKHQVVKVLKIAHNITDFIEGGDVDKSSQKKKKK